MCTCVCQPCACVRARVSVCVCVLVCARVYLCVCAVRACVRAYMRTSVRAYMRTCARAPAHALSNRDKLPPAKAAAHNSSRVVPAASKHTHRHKQHPHPHTTPQGSCRARGKQAHVRTDTNNTHTHTQQFTTREVSRPTTILHRQLEQILNQRGGGRRSGNKTAFSTDKKDGSHDVTCDAFRRRAPATFLLFSWQEFPQTPERAEEEGRAGGKATEVVWAAVTACVRPTAAIYNEGQAGRWLRTRIQCNRKW